MRIPGASARHRPVYGRMHVPHGAFSRRCRTAFARCALGERVLSAHRRQIRGGVVRSQCIDPGAALAFYTIFSVAPILIIAVAIAGAVFGPDTAQTEVLSHCGALTGDAGAAAIRELLTSAHYSDKKGIARRSAS